MKRRRTTRQGFTMVEVLVASVCGLGLLMSFWACFGQGGHATARMMETMKVMDTATVQSYIDEDLRTATEILVPGDLGADKTLIFSNRECRSIEYSLRKSDEGYTLIRVDGARGSTKVLAKGLKDGFFYRSGPNLVGYRMSFAPRRNPSSSSKMAAPALAMSSRVFLANVLF